MVAETSPELKQSGALLEPGDVARLTRVAFFVRDSVTFSGSALPSEAIAGRPE